MNMVYERFFQGYSVKDADTHGIVYTPQEIVDLERLRERGSLDRHGIGRGTYYSLQSPST
jgi:predicted helicase